MGAKKTTQGLADKVHQSDLLPKWENHYAYMVSRGERNNSSENRQEI